MHHKLRSTFRGRGFYLLGGTLCATVVVVVAACCTISLLTIGRATQQQSRAIDAAIAAFDLYQQERSPLNNSVSDAAALLDTGGALSKLAADPTDVALREQAARRLASFENANTGDVLAAYVVLRDASGEVSFVLGSSTAVADARDYDERVGGLDLDELASHGHAVTRLASTADDDVWSVGLLPYLDNVDVMAFYQMPEVPNVEVLEPIADIAEMYFVDAQGGCYPVSTSKYIDAIDIQAAVDSPDNQGILSITHSGEAYREYFHKPGDYGLVFLFIVPDVAQAASQQFALTVLLATALLVALGCAAGLFLTRRIYEPLQVIIAKLAPDGRDVRDEFKLIGLALDAMENRLSEQDETVAEFHLMRLLRGRTSLAQEGAGFFFAEPSSEVALAIVRCDDPGTAKQAKRAAALGDGGKGAQRMLTGATAGSGEVGGIAPGRTLPGGKATGAETQGAAASGWGASPLTEPIREYLRSRGRECALCEESGFVFVVVDAQGGGVRPLFEGMVEHLRESGLLVSAFVSNVHAGSAKLSLCYRESLTALESGTRKGAFNKVVRYERPTGPTDGRKAGSLSAEGAGASGAAGDSGAAGAASGAREGRAGGADADTRGKQETRAAGADTHGGRAGRAPGGDAHGEQEARAADADMHGRQADRVPDTDANGGRAVQATGADTYDKQATWAAGADDCGRQADRATSVNACAEQTDRAPGISAHDRQAGRVTGADARNKQASRMADAGVRDGQVSRATGAGADGARVAQTAGARDGQINRMASADADGTTAARPAGNMRAAQTIGSAMDDTRAAQAAGSPARRSQGVSPDTACAPQSGMHAPTDGVRAPQPHTQATSPDGSPSLQDTAQGAARLSSPEDLPADIEDVPLPRGGMPSDERNAADLLAYVRENYRDPALTASLVAERFGMSRAGVSRAFAKACPEGGFLGYLHGLRLDKAEELLRTTSLGVPEVAEAAGYGSALTMSRAFKRYRDTTPGAFRKSCAEGGQGSGAGKKAGKE